MIDTAPAALRHPARPGAAPQVRVSVPGGSACTRS